MNFAGRGGCGHSGGDALFGMQTRHLCLVATGIVVPEEAWRLHNFLTGNSLVSGVWFLYLITLIKNHLRISVFQAKSLHQYHHG